MPIRIQHPHRKRQSYLPRPTAILDADDPCDFVPLGDVVADIVTIIGKQLAAHGLSLNYEDDLAQADFDRRAA